MARAEGPRHSLGGVTARAPQRGGGGGEGGVPVPESWGGGKAAWKPEERPPRAAQATDRLPRPPAAASAAGPRPAVCSGRGGRGGACREAGQEAGPAASPWRHRRVPCPAAPRVSPGEKTPGSGSSSQSHPTTTPPPPASLPIFSQRPPPGSAGSGERLRPVAADSGFKFQNPEAPLRLLEDSQSDSRGLTLICIYQMYTHTYLHRCTFIPSRV